MGQCEPHEKKQKESHSVKWNQQSNLEYMGFQMAYLDRGLKVVTRNRLLKFRESKWGKWILKISNISYMRGDLVVERHKLRLIPGSNVSQGSFITLERVRAPLSLCLYTSSRSSSITHNLGWPGYPSFPIRPISDRNAFSKSGHESRCFTFQVEPSCNTARYDVPRESSEPNEVSSLQILFLNNSF